MQLRRRGLVTLDAEGADYHRPRITINEKGMALMRELAKESAR